LLVFFPGTAEYIEKQKVNKKLYGPTRGAALYEAHLAVGKVVGSNLPKYSEDAWPPPFRQTVTMMRTFLEEHCGQSSRWSQATFNYHKAYFNRVFGLHGTSVNINEMYSVYS